MHNTLNSNDKWHFEDHTRQVFAMLGHGWSVSRCGVYFMPKHRSTNMLMCDKCSDSLQNSFKKNGTGGITYQISFKKVNSNIVVREVNFDLPKLVEKV